MAQASATDSSSKIQKLSNEEAQFNSTIDKISSLPDSLLCHILSFLPTKHAVATSILSKRWKNLWTSVLTLDFNDEFDAPDYDGEELLNPVWRDGIGVGSMSFAFIVYRVLVLRNNASCIKRFRLRCCRNCDPLHYNAWVCAAIARDVEELDLYKSFQPVELPQSLFFTCKNLKVLELIGEFFLNVPSSVHFPSLKFMRLLSVKYQNDDSIRKLLSGCPVLEDFSIIGFRDDSAQIFNVSAPSLKKLTIRWIAHYPEKTPRKLEINAPALDYLILDDFAEAFSIENLSSLAGARVHVRKVWEHDEYYGKCAFELLRGLYNVKLLSLTDYTLETLKFASSYDLPMFHNLTRLEIGSDWHLLSNFLESAPNLEVLFLDKEDFQDDGHSCWRQPQRVPKCLSSHFGRIYIRKFKGLKDEVKLVRYILKNAKVLKTMRIYASVLNSKRKLRLLKKLSMFPRGSETCQLAFS